MHEIILCSIHLQFLATKLYIHIYIYIYICIYIYIHFKHIYAMQKLYCSILICMKYLNYNYLDIHLEIIKLFYMTMIEVKVIEKFIFLLLACLYFILLF